MPRSLRRVAALLVLCFFCSCSSGSIDPSGPDGSVDAGGDAGVDAGEVVCAEHDEACAAHGDCCSGYCTASNLCDFPTGEIDCALYGAACLGNADCCSTICNASKLCDAPVACAATDSPCQQMSDCCSFNCVDNLCSATRCLADAEGCSGDASCCSGQCDTTCVPLSNTCKTLGNPCAEATECCSGYCQNSYCGSPSFCTLSGDACTLNTECCSGSCTIVEGTRGLCAAAPTGPSSCGGDLDGILCARCGDCCSRLCAPYANSGILICQPAQGCRTNGNTCTRNEDCCGGDPSSGLPGAGSVTCVKASPSDPVGICRNPTGCPPEGSVCHMKDYACDNSSAPNSCCPHPVTKKKGLCVLDTLGVPRCNAYTGDACREVGATCAFSGNCCDNHPCVADTEGVLRCGATECIPADGSCTVGADCCPGLLCITPPGSIKGTCSTEQVSSCSQYGQVCSATQHCCEGLLCNTVTGTCFYPLT